MVWAVFRGPMVWLGGRSAHDPGDARLRPLGGWLPPFSAMILKSSRNLTSSVLVPEAVVIHFHKLGGLKQQKCVLLVLEARAPSEAGGGSLLASPVSGCQRPVTSPAL